MDRKSKILFYFFTALIVLAVFATYHKYMIREEIVFFTDSETVPGSFDGIKDLFNKQQ